MYWNGCIHWLSKLNSESELESTVSDCFCFNVDDERLETFPRPPTGVRSASRRRSLYFGESEGHLHFVEACPYATSLNVYEMKSDYSGWFLKYQIDLDPISKVFPEMTKHNKAIFRDKNDYAVAVRSLIGRENFREDPFLVLEIPEREREERWWEWIAVVAMVMLLVLAFVQDSHCNESFKDCYIKCYVFCMIEPSQTLCTCTTRCFKNCLLPSISSTTTATTQSRHRSDDSIPFIITTRTLPFVSLDVPPLVARLSAQSIIQMGRMWIAVLVPALTSASRRTHYHHLSRRKASFGSIADWNQQC